jgi:hypothetical protein
MAVSRYGLTPIIFFGLLLCLGGCSDDLGDRLAVNGAVTLKGQPLDQGSIEFIPLDQPAAGEAETKSGAPIEQGQYEIPRAHGLVPGKYRVRITAGTGTPPLAPGELPGPSAASSKERIPAKYNVKSDIEATVTSSGPNTFNYEIP